MRTVQTSEVKAHLAEILRTVERGETVAITRRGQTVAHMVPATKNRKSQYKEAVERFRQRRSKWKPSTMTVEDILLARHEGRSL